MLPVKFINGSISLAQTLTVRGIKLKAKAGSPLNDLISCASTYPCFSNGKTSEDYTLEELIGIVSSSTSLVGADGGCTHSILITNIVNLIKPVAQGTVRFAKNEALPTIKELYDTIVDRIAGYRSTLGEPFIITVTKPDLVFLDNAVTEMAQAYENTHYVELSLKGFPTLSKETILETIKKSFRGLSEVVEAELDDASYVRISQAYSTAISHETLSDNELAVLFLISRSTADDPFEGTNLPLHIFNLKNSELMSQTGRTLCIRLKKASYNEKTNSLYIGAPESKLTGDGSVQRIIKVNPKTYTTLLEKGLTAEAIYGNELGGRKYNGQQLLEHKDQLEKAYTANRAILTMAAKNNLSAFIKKAFESTFKAYIKNTEVEKAYSEPVLFDRFYKALKRHDHIDENKLCSIVRDVACETLYGGTDVGFYLQIMDEVAEKYNLEPREAASVALIEYLTHWFMSQLEVTQ